MSAPRCSCSRAASTSPGFDILQCGQGCDAFRLMQGSTGNLYQAGSTSKVLARAARRSPDASHLVTGGRWQPENR